MIRILQLFNLAYILRPFELELLKSLNSNYLYSSYDQLFYTLVKRALKRAIFRYSETNKKLCNFFEPPSSALL